VKRAFRKSGFSLIELVTVMAITAVLLGIIIVPVIQSFNFTRAAEGLADEQQRGRILIEQITRDVANGAGVRDNEGLPGETVIYLPSKNGTTMTDVHLRNARIDILKPAQGDAVQTPGVFVNSGNGRVDPTMHAPDGQVQLPAAPGSTIVRYFIGLRRPLATDGLHAAKYNNPYDNTIQPVGTGQDNLFVLYRAEFQPYKPGGAFNDTYFQADPTDATKPYLDDPLFFTQDPTSPTSAQATRIANWQKISTVVTQETRYDMIQPLISPSTGKVIYTTDTVPKPEIASLIQFRPTPVTQEPVTGEAAMSLGTEADQSTNPQLGLAPNVFRTKMGGWSSLIVVINPFTATPTGTSDYLKLDIRPAPVSPTAEFMQLSLHLDPSNPINSSLPPVIQMFDLTKYDQLKATPPGPSYPFSQAIYQADQINGGGSKWLSMAQRVRDLFIPIMPNAHSGELYTNWGIEEVGNPLGTTKNQDNVPQVPTVGSDGIAYTPLTDPNVATGNFYDTTFASINERYNKIYMDPTFVTLRPLLQRFVDLRVTPQMDGWASPMDPNPDGTIRIPWVNTWTGFSNVTITPGTDTIIAPDQNPGPDYGQPIRYTRVNHTPGLNQYRINYTNLQEPTDYSSIDSTLPVPATPYDPENITSMIFQPRFKVGYIQFDSDPNVPMPGVISGVTGSGLVHISYRFQFNRPGDAIAVDYDSREVMNVLLTVRSFPEGSLPNAQSITLQANAPVRNFLR
jgi:prepilin-type N-terminal cleavage/methylation domain-containing protein